MLFAGVNQRLRSVGPFFRRILRRVKPCAPRVSQHIDVIDGISAAAHSPDDLVRVGWVDILVNGDDPFCIISAAGHLGRER